MADGDPVLAVLRPADRMEEAAKVARDHGFEPLLAPLLEVAPAPPAAFDALIRALQERSAAWVVFTSENAVQHAWRMADRAEHSMSSLLHNARVAAVGPVTQAALRQRGVEALVPERHDSAGLVALLAAQASQEAAPPLAGARVALVRSDQGSPELPEGLRREGAQPFEVPVYLLALPRNLEPARDLVQRAARGEVHAFAFTSTLTARHFLQVAAEQEGIEERVRRGLEGAKVGALGEPTASALRALGVRCDLVADEARFEALVAELRALLREAGR